MEGQNLGVPYWAIFADYTFLILVFSISRITIDLNISSYCFYLDFWNSFPKGPLWSQLQLPLIQP